MWKGISGGIQALDDPVLYPSILPDILVCTQQVPQPQWQLDPEESGRGLLPVLLYMSFSWTPLQASGSYPVGFAAGSFASTLLTMGYQTADAYRSVGNNCFIHPED